MSRRAAATDRAPGGSPPGVAPTARPAGRWRRARGLALPAGAVLLGLAPFFLLPGPLDTLGRILLYALLAASLDLLVGTTGLPSLGHAAYFAVGGYTAGLLAQHATTWGPTQFAAAVVAGGLAAALTGWLAVRSRGTYFLMLTLAVGGMVAALALTWEEVTQGSNGLYGIPAVTLTPGGSPLVAPAPAYWYTFAGFVVGFTVLWLVCASPFGMALRGIRDNETRMRAIGYPTFWYKYAAFCLAGAVAGGAGSLLAAHERLVTPSDAGFETAGLALLAVVIGGSGSLWGPCLGAAAVLLVRDTIGSELSGHGPLLLGLVFIACVYLLPRGVAGLRPTARRRRA